MPYTTRDKVTLVSSGATEEASFYQADITALLNQPGASRVTNYIATLADESSSEEFSILIAQDSELALLDEPNHLVALSCPPFDDDAGVFLSNPRLP